MKDRLTEQQLQEELLGEIGDFTKAISRKIGQGTGVVTGAGQKIKGVTKRSVDALGNAFQQGKQQTQKAVAGKDYKAPSQKQQGPGFLKKATGAITTGIGKADAYAQKALDKVNDISNYDWRQDDAIKDRSQQTYTGVGGAQVGKNPKSSNLTQKNQAATQTTNAKTGGKVKGKVSNTSSAKYQRDLRARKKAGSGAVNQGIKTAGQPTKSGNVQRDSTGKIISKGSGVQRDSKGKVISNTASKISTNTNVPSAKIAGQKLDFNDPKNANILKQIQKKSGT